MYEHPYLAQKVAEFDLEQLERRIERRRFLAEHADQIVPRPAGRLRSMTDRMLRRSAVPADAGAPADRRATGAPADRRATGACADRRAAGACEPAVAR